MALEALKLLAGIEPATTDAFLHVDLLAPAITRVRCARRTACTDCSRR
jgi:hypothetical protein